MSRRARAGEVVCTCPAYDFPHRQFGGDCSLLRWVEEFFSPWCKECEDCINRDRHECQCTTGTEEPSHCPELRDYIRYEGITLYGRARAVMDRSTKR